MKTILHKLLLIVFIITNQLVNAQINTSSFSAYTNLAVATNGSINAATGDLDGDGKLDLVTANEATGVLSVFKNTSSLSNISFASRVDSVASSNLGFVHLVDLNGDGKLDIVASTSINNSVVVYKNLSTVGNIVLGSKQTFGVGGTNAWGMWFGDLDGDNKPDIVTSNSGGGSYSILRNSSNATTINFGTASVITAAALVNPSQVLVADLDGDNRKDIVFFNNMGNNLVIYKNLTLTIGTVSISNTPVLLTTNSGAHRGDIADVDGDGRPDIVSSNYFSNNSSIFRNTSLSGTIAFAAKVDFAASSNVNSTLLKDIDNDGKPELIQSFGTGVSSKVGIYRNFASAGTINTSSFGTRIDFVVGNEPRGLTVEDLNGDGKLDIVTANYYSTNLSILKNTTIPSNGLIAYYPFNGNAGDSSGFGNHGTLGVGQNAPVLTSDRFGKLNSAYYFDGNTDIITVAKSNALQPNNQLTLSAWIKSEVKLGTAWNTILTYRHTIGSAPFNSYILTTNNASPYNGKWMFGLTDASTSTLNEFVSKNVRADNQWIHICATFDGAKVSIYKNALLDTSFNLGVGAIGYGTMGLHIGNNNVGVPDAFKGSMDDLRIYNRALDSNEVKALSREGLLPTYYTKSTGSINQLSTWGTNPDGSGDSPLSFDSSYCKYNVVNNNTTLSGSFKIGGTNNVLVFGNGSSAFNFAIASTDTISCDSMYLNTSATLTVSGTLQSAKFNTSTSSTVQYIGSNPQTIAAGIYENIVTSASTKTLTGNVTVRGVLAMISTINCNNNELTLGTSATSRGTLNRSSGTIVGRFSRWFANTTNAGTTGLFPIGTSTKYTPIQIEFTTAPTVGGKLTCEFIAGAPGNTGLPQFDFSNGFVFIDKASIDGVVRHTSTGITGGTFTATFTANNYVGVFNYSNLRLLQRNIGGNWNLVGNAGTNTGTNTAAVISRSALTMLTGELGIGGDQSENPLPIKLTTLSAKLITNQTTQINWQTAFEYNSAKYIVQRSLDKNKWTNRGEIKSKGNSTATQNYSFIDDVNGLTNVVYYRLIQVDLDGTSTSSKIVSVVLAKQAIATLQVYPNPATDKFTITGLNAKAMLFDITGKQQLEILADGEINIAHLPAGMYFLRTENEAIKIVKRN